MSRGGGRNLSSIRAFTLAEVLVTLGIIGVVSAMTVPSLMQNHQRKTYVTQLHKVYNELNQVFLQYQTDKNAVNLSEAGLNNQQSVYDLINRYMKVVNTCDTATTPCFQTSYKYINGNAAAGYNTGYKSFVLASGASIRIVYGNEGNILLWCLVDTNGLKGPNIFGRDAFIFYVYKNGLIDDGPSNGENNAPLTKEEREELNCEGSMNGCFGRLLNDNWEMNY